MQVCLLADCGGHVGWGHYARCLALAEEFQSRGVRVVFHVNGTLPPIPSAVPTVQAGGIGDTRVLTEIDRFTEIVVLDLFAWSRVEPERHHNGPLMVAIRDGIDPGPRFDVWVDP